MRPILMDNAFEAWAAAIRYCNDIKDGKATLQYQKNFVSSLHNAVELIMKQMLLNNNDHNIIRCLYEDRVSGRITPERYDSMANGYEQEQAEKKRELQELAERISEVDMRDQCIQQFIRDAKRYIEMPKLTPELLRVFIRRIEVYEKFEKYSRTAGNPIRIHYAFRLPEQEGVPAIEVLTQPTAKTA